MLTRDGNADWQNRLRDWINPMLGKSDLTLPSYRFRNLAQHALLEFSPVDGYDDVYLNAARKRKVLLTDMQVRTALETTRGYLPRIEPDYPFEGVLRVKGTFHESNLDGMKRILDLATAHGIKVIVTTTPMPESAHTKETEATMAAALARVAEFLKAYPQAQLMAPRFYPNDHFAALYHLNEKGATLNTQDVNKLIIEAEGATELKESKNDSRENHPDHS